MSRRRLFRAKSHSRFSGLRMKQKSIENIRYSELQNGRTFWQDSCLASFAAFLLERRQDEGFFRFWIDVVIRYQIFGQFAAAREFLSNLRQRAGPFGHNSPRRLVQYRLPFVIFFIVALHIIRLLVFFQSLKIIQIFYL